MEKGSFLSNRRVHRLLHFALLRLASTRSEIQQFELLILLRYTTTLCIMSPLQMLLCINLSLYASTALCRLTPLDWCVSCNLEREAIIGLHEKVSDPKNLAESRYPTASCQHVDSLREDILFLSRPSDLCVAAIELKILSPCAALC